jgi:hypothetical protein
VGALRGAPRLVARLRRAEAREEGVAADAVDEVGLIGPIGESGAGSASGEGSESSASSESGAIGEGGEAVGSTSGIAPGSDAPGMTGTTREARA